MTRVGLLRMCELPPPAVAAEGSYLTVFRKFFRDHPVEIVDIPVHEGATPGSIDDCDAWVVTGSPASTYDELEWIRAGEEIIRSLVAAERPTIGICFGHQLMAQALGGRVEKAAVGWGAGAHRYDVLDRPSWLPAAPSAMTMLAMHQDQVVEAPTDSVVWATSDFCPIAGLTYGERAWSVQPHPEFTAPIVEALCLDRVDRLGADVAHAAIASLDLQLDGHLVADAAVGAASQR